LKVFEGLLWAVRFVGRQERAFKANMLRASLQNFAEELTRQFQSVYIYGLGASASELGAVNSARGIASIATSLLAGLVADRYGLRAAFTAAMLFMASGSLMLAAAISWIAAAPALLVFYLGLTMSITACPVVCGAALRDEERATGRGICDTATALPRLVSPLIAAQLVALFGGLNVDGIRPLYYVQAATLFAALLVALTLFEEPSRRRLVKPASRRSSSLESVVAVFTKGTAARRWVVVDSLSKIPQYVASNIYVPLYAAKIKGADQFTLGLMASAAALTPIIFSIPMGRFADSAGRKKAMYLATSVYVASLLLLVYAKSPAMLVLSAFLQGFSEIASVIRGAMTAELFPVHLLGSAYGALGLFRGLTSLIAPIVGGLIWDRLGPDHVFTFVITTQLTNIAILITVPETLRRP